MRGNATLRRQQAMNGITAWLEERMDEDVSHDRE
jgi:hypothetical protein